MGSTSRATLEMRLSEAIGDYETLTNDAASGSTTTTLVDADLADLTESDDGIQGWVEITSGDAEGDIRRIKASGGYTASTTTITVNNAFSSDPGDAITYLLHRTNPTLKRNAIGQAIRQLYQTLYLPIRDETLIVDNLLANSDFETFSGGFTSWTEVGSPTVTQETSRVFHGSSSAKIISAGGAAGQLTQAPDINLPEVAGKTATFKAWGWASAATNLRLRLDWDGADIDSGSYHDGDSSWRLLTVSATVPSSATQVKAIIEVVAGTVTAYADLSWLTILPIYKYTIPTSIINGPHKLHQQANSSNPAGNFLPIPTNGAPTPGRILRLEGMGQLSVPTTASGTTEVDGPRVDLIVAKALELLYTTLAWQEDGADYLFAMADKARAEQARLMRQNGVRMMPLAAEMPNNNWHTQEDSSGRYIIFENNRDLVSA